MPPTDAYRRVVRVRRKMSELGFDCDIHSPLHAIEELAHLVRHCWVHSGYPDCGYGQMTTEQKALYRRVIGREEDE